MSNNSARHMSTPQMLAVVVDSALSVGLLILLDVSLLQSWS